MRRPVTTLFSAAIIVLAATACHSSTSGKQVDTDSPAAGTKAATLPMFKHNPEDRTTVRKEPVAEYKVRTDDKLNEQYFTVKLYETDKTMRYLVKMDFEGLGGEDTIKLPDLGTPPQPVIEKSTEKYGCIIGLLDNDHKFRALKKVYVTEQGRELKVKTLKHYAVNENYELKDQ